MVQIPKHCVEAGASEFAVALKGHTQDSPTGSVQFDTSSAAQVIDQACQQAPVRGMLRQ